MRIRGAVPRLSDGGERDTLWDFCHAHWRRELPEMEIIEGHHEGERPFNRSAAINKAAEGDWDVLVILDGDVVIDGGDVRQACDLAVESGRLVLPFDRRQMLSRSGTRRILQGKKPPWRRFVAATERDRVSCCVVVPRALWDRVGGFDERFEGWGGEDEAFFAACREIGGFERLDGEVWHLHHRPSPFQNRRAPTHRQARHLTYRYERTEGTDAMGRLLAESRSHDQVALVVLTTGRRETLPKALASAEENLRGPIGRRLIVVDGPQETADQVHRDHSGWDVERIDGGDYPRATAAAVDRAIGCGQPWVFWLEDDFTFEQPVDIAQMQALMEAHPELAQLSLLRQAWFEHETAAGGVFAAKPGCYVQRDGFVATTDHWTMNPMLVRRETLASFDWPKGRDSERRFGHAIYATGLVTGYLGTLDDPPLVTHIGHERAGTGY